MNKSLLLFALLAFVASSRLMKEHPPSNEVNQVQYWFDQQLLDHSDPTNTQTWSQRYWVIDEFFKQPEHPHPPHSDSDQPEHRGPQNAVILYICGEYTCIDIALMSW